MGMTGLPPGEFSLISPGTKIPGQVITAFVAGVIETVAVGEILDRPRLTDDASSGKK